MLTGIDSRGRADDAVEPGTSKQEILHHLQDVRRIYGDDAVLMQGSLLAQTVRGGSILEAAISIPGVEEHRSKRFLIFQLDTGIVYNDRDVPDVERPGQLWAAAVETTLRKFRSLTVPADGITLRLSYRHAAFESEAALRTQTPQPPGAAESLTCYFLTSDITDLAAERISAQQLLDRSVILVNGVPAHVVLAIARPTASSE